MKLRNIFLAIIFISVIFSPAVAAQNIPDDFAWIVGGELISLLNRTSLTLDENLSVVPATSLNTVGMGRDFFYMADVTLNNLHVVNRTTNELIHNNTEFVDIQGLVADNNTLFVAAPGDNKIITFNATSFQPLGNISEGLNNPMYVEVDGKGSLWVTNNGNDSLVRINISDYSIMSITSVGKQPRQMHLDDNVVYVGNGGSVVPDPGTISLVNASNGAFIANQSYNTISGGWDMVGDDDFLWLTVYTDDKFFKINKTDMAVVNLTDTSSGNYVEDCRSIEMDDTWLYCTNEGGIVIGGEPLVMHIINKTTNQVAHNITGVGNNPTSLGDFIGYQFGIYNDGNQYTSTLGGDSPPAISNVQSTPDPANQSQVVKINATVTDDNQVSFVDINISAPGIPEILNFTMSNLSSIYDFNFTNTSNVGTYNFTIFATDNSSQVTEESGNFTINSSLPLTPSNLSILPFDNPTSPVNYSPTTNYIFSANITTNGTIDTVIFESNFTGSFVNQTPGTNDNITFQINQTTLAASIYQITWYANTTDNVNATDVHSYTVNPISRNLTLLANGASSDITIDNGTTINITGDIGEGTPSLFLNGSLIDTGAPVQNLTVGVTGTYIFQYNITGSGNFSDESITRVVTVRSAGASTAILEAISLPLIVGLLGMIALFLTLTIVLNNMFAKMWALLTTFGFSVVTYSFMLQLMGELGWSEELITIATSGYRLLFFTFIVVFILVFIFLLVKAIELFKNVTGKKT